MLQPCPAALPTLISQHTQNSVCHILKGACIASTGMSVILFLTAFTCIQEVHKKSDIIRYIYRDKNPAQKCGGNPQKKMEDVVVVHWYL